MKKNIFDYEDNFIEEIDNKLSKTKEYYIKTNEGNNNVFSLPIQLVYLTLPYKSTQEVSWKKSVNDFTLSVTSGINGESGKHYGIPFGTMARKLMYFTCTEAAKKQSQTIKLGSSYTEAFKNLGIADKRAGGYAINHFKDQVLKLFFSRISLSGGKKNKLSEYNIKQALNLAKGMEFFANGERFDFTITLTNDFYEYILNNTLIPFDNHIINLLGNNAMLMDLYIFLNYKAYTANKYRKDVFVSFEELYKAFGTFSLLKTFKQNVKKNIKKLLEYHKGLLIEETAMDNQDGVIVSKLSQSNVASKQFEQMEMFVDPNNNVE